ncbi:MAG: sigma-54 dependent transcriptional regulator [Syntrophobacteria bacterium]
MTTKILIVDDDPRMRKSLSNLLNREGYGITEAPGGKEAADHLGRDVFDLVIADLKMEPVSGLDLLRLVKQMSPDVEVILITAFGTIEVAVKAMKLGAFDFITKPFQVEEILLRVRNALEKHRLKEEVNQLRTEVKTAFGFEGIVGMSEVLTILPRVAQTDSTVLVTGESGTGKELVARAIHAASRRPRGTFVSVSCAALPEQLLENELFGHVKGAFTGALAARKGLLEEANGGTFFLDEIGDASLSIQAKLLRVLEDRSIRRIGDNRSIPVDVRMVAATNRDLQSAMREKLFREDLFYRLNVIPIHVPPLRERGGDIPPLVAHFIEKYHGKIKKQVSGVSPQAMTLLMAYRWPGNVRELENVIQRMMVVAKGDTLDVQDLPPEILGKEAPHEKPKDMKGITRESAGLAEKNLILDALTKSRGNVTQAARSLGISRVTLQKKMKMYNLRDPTS